MHGPVKIVLLEDNFHDQISRDINMCMHVYLGWAQDRQISNEGKVPTYVYIYSYI